jgi:serine/threonine protein kinase
MNSEGRFAVKIIPAAESSWEQEDNFQVALSKEIYLWKQLDHPNILPVVEVIETAGVCYIVSQLMEGGHLLDFVSSMGPLQESVALNIFKEICQGVHYLHADCHIAHRDLKLENVLLEYEKGIAREVLQPQHIHSVKICDFGLSERCHPSTGFPGDEFDKTTHEISGTPEYCSPEELSSETGIDYFKTDIWTLGVILYGLLSGRLPFRDDFWPHLQRSIKLSEFDPLPDVVSEPAKDLVAQLLTPDPENRPRISDVLNHAWFNQLAPLYTPYDEQSMTFS